MSALQRRATRKGHTNVLMHLLGFLRTQLDKADRTRYRAFGPATCSHFGSSGAT